MRRQEKVSTAYRQDSVLGSEDGSVIILALVILMLLTMIGTSATNTSTLEIQVAGNERKYKQNFFQAEAAALQGAQRIENATVHTEAPIKDENDADVTNIFNWTHEASAALRATRFDAIAQWEDLEAEFDATYKNTHYLILYRGIAPWSSEVMTSPTQSRIWSIYGQRLNTATNERMIIATGYARRM